MADNPYEQGGDNPFTRKAMAQPIPAMTLRDWFAGQALAGFTACHLEDGDAIMGAADTAKAAYNYADAMLAERAK